MKLRVHVGRLVVHGAAHFDREAFERALAAEMAARLPAAGADAADTAQRIRQGKGRLEMTGAAPARKRGVADAAAESLGARLLGRPSAALAARGTKG